MYFGSIFVSADFNLMDFLKLKKHLIFQKLEKLTGLKSREICFVLHEISNCSYIKGLDVYSNVNLNIKQLKIQKGCIQNLHILI